MGDLLKTELVICLSHSLFIRITTQNVEDKQPSVYPVTVLHSRRFSVVGYLVHVANSALHFTVFYLKKN
jgi:hypothetical protein